MLRPGVKLVPDHAYGAAYLLQVDGTDQSYVDLDDPTRLEFDYVERIADVVNLMPPPGGPLRVVHLGGAGLTLPRYIAARRPGSTQIVLEPDAELTEFVRRHLPLPRRSGIKVRAVDGRAGLNDVLTDSADLLIIDAFTGAQVPAELTTVAFLAEVRRVLRPAGIVVCNLTDRGPSRYARRVLAGLKEVFPHAVLCAEPATLKGRRFGNILLVASRQPLPVAELARRAGAGAYPYRVVHGARLNQLTAGLAGFGPGDAEPSPPPPLGRHHFR